MKMDNKIKSYIVRGMAVVAVAALMSGCDQKPSSSNNNASSPNYAPACSTNPYLMKYNCSIDRIQTAAENGSADAQYALGYMYYYGIGTVKDKQTAQLWIQRSAAQGQPLAKKAWTLINTGATFTDLHNAAAEGTDLGASNTIVQQEPVDVTEMNAKKPGAPITKYLPVYDKPAQSQNTTDNTTASNIPADNTTTANNVSDNKTADDATSNQHLSSLSSHSANDPRLAANAKPVVANNTQSATMQNNVPLTAQESLVPKNAVVTAQKTSSTQDSVALSAQETLMPKDDASTDAVVATQTPTKNTVNTAQATSNTVMQYTVQLMGSDKKSDLESFVAQNNLGSAASYFKTQLKGKPWYMLTYGQYSTEKQAETALAQLPQAVKDNHPWVKSFATVEKEVRLQKVIA